MARSSKNKAPAPSLTKAQKLKIIGDAARDIIRIKSEMKALAEDITAARGRVKQTGVKASDFGVVLRLYTLEVEDRDDSLDGLSLCAEALNIDLGGESRQPDLFEEAAVADRRLQDPEPGSVELVEADDDDEPADLLDGLDGEVDAVGGFGGDEGEAEPASDWAAAAAADDEEFDDAGYVHAGKEAGFAGVGAEANPHEAGSREAEAWERGRMSGAERAEIEVDRYNDGWAAHKAGSPRDANPHEADTDAHGRWDLGWTERQAKAEREDVARTVPAEAA